MRAILSGQRLFGSNFIFQQDNDPEQSSQMFKIYM